MSHFTRVRELVSIRTPIKGVTIRSKSQFSNISVSIHTPSKGVTLDLLPSYNQSHVSIHTPIKGVTANLTKFHFDFSTFLPDFLVKFCFNIILFHIFLHINQHFVHFFRCESPSVFMCATHSHLFPYLFP